jgi:hypothetical protein
MKPFFVALALVAIFNSPSNASSIRTYVLAIGNNNPPVVVGRAPTERASRETTPLHYADDDAAAFFHLTGVLARFGILLTQMDAETQRRFPDESAIARAPTLGELRSAVETLRVALLADRARGAPSTVLVFYSGHGSWTNSTAQLALLDGGLTREVLYEEVLAKLPADYIHLFVDACYAEAIVRPRDVDASVVNASGPLLDEYEASHTLARFPNVGALVASSGASQTHEWDAYGHGVFTEELLSGLRGAADVNGDGRVEYSELYAFLSSANREVRDARARLSVVMRPPTANRRAAIVDLSEFRGQSHLVGIPGAAGHVFLEDQLGNRLADLHPERGVEVSLVLPPERVIYVHCRAGEARIVLSADQTITFAELTMAPATNRTRGAIGDAMADGLFASTFGPSYYRGFVDQASDLVSVSFPEQDSIGSGSALGAASVKESIFATLKPREVSHLLWATGVEKGVENALGPMVALRVGYRPVGPTNLTISADAGWGSAATFSEWRGILLAEYRVSILRGAAVVPAFGLQAGIGIAGQKTHSGTSGWTGLGMVGPCASVAYRVRPSIGLELDVGMPASFYRQDDTFAASFLPAAFLGATLPL